MNSIINLISSDIPKSFVEIQKDGAAFDVPVKNLFDVTLPFTLNSSNVSNGLGLKFALGRISNDYNFVGLDFSYNLTTLGLSVVELYTLDDVNYSEGEWGIISPVNLSINNLIFSVSSSLNDASLTLCVNYEQDNYNVNNGKNFIKYAIYNTSGAVVPFNGNLSHACIFIQIV